jgi:hypothetical protein
MSTCIKEARWSPEVERLRDAWVKNEPGSLSTHEQIRDIIGNDSPYWHIVRRVRDILRREHKIHYITEHGIGFRRARQGESIDDSKRRLTRVRHQSRAAREEIMCDEFEKLSREKQIDYMSNNAIWGSLDLFSTKRAINKVNRIASHSQTKLDEDLVRQTLSLFT